MRKSFEGLAQEGKETNDLAAMKPDVFEPLCVSFKAIVSNKEFFAEEHADQETLFKLVDLNQIIQHLTKIVQISPAQLCLIPTCDQSPTSADQLGQLLSHLGSRHAAKPISSTTESQVKLEWKSFCHWIAAEPNQQQKPLLLQSQVLNFFCPVLTVLRTAAGKEFKGASLLDAAKRKEFLAKIQDQSGDAQFQGCFLLVDCFLSSPVFLPLFAAISEKVKKAKDGKVEPGDKEDQESDDHDGETGPTKKSKKGNEDTPKEKPGDEGTGEGKDEKEEEEDAAGDGNSNGDHEAREAQLENFKHLIGKTPDQILEILQNNLKDLKLVAKLLGLEVGTKRPKTLAKGVSEILIKINGANK